RLLTDTLGSRGAALFHGLNQRLPRRRFRKQIATFHDLFVFSGEYSTPEFRARFIEQARQAAAGADLIIAVSRFTAGQVEEYLSVPSSRIRVVHHGVLPRTIPDLPRENVVLCLGAIQRRKNQARLVRAFRAMPADWRLVLAGSEGFEARETLDEISKSPASDRILVTGYLTDAQVGEWYARARIFAFPSLDEGFGIPIAEAMAAGIPVIVGNRSALPEVAGDAGLAVDPYDVEELSGALVRLAGEPELRHALGEAGRNRAAHFTWAGAVAETLKCYRELL
ncbi:MAG: glycosyltransferase family 1 protein, partial [Acidobacteriia bacterium]|nr:glycosyltransferase family 1 protein [Terriglobia bacterium]